MAKLELPPAGGRKNLRKPMPKRTRYKGESCFASDIVGRYEEHMQKQRAAAAQSPQGTPKDSAA